MGHDHIGPCPLWYMTTSVHFYGTRSTSVQEVHFDTWCISVHKIGIWTSSVHYHFYLLQSCFQVAEGKCWLRQAYHYLHKDLPTRRTTNALFIGPSRWLAHDQRHGGRLLITILLQSWLGAHFGYATCVGCFGLVMQFSLRNVIARCVRTGRLRADLQVPLLHWHWHWIGWQWVVVPPSRQLFVPLIGSRRIASKCE